MADANRLFAIALMLDGQGGARELSDAEAANWNAIDGLVWLDIDQTNRHSREWLLQHSGLDPDAIAILLAGETRPRSLPVADGLVTIMRGINMNPGSVPDDMVAVRIWMDDRRIVTSRRRRVLSVSDVRDALVAGQGPKSTGEFLVVLTSRLAGRIEAAVENVEEMIENLEEKLALGEIEDVRSELSVVRRQAAAIRRHLTPQREALDRLARNPAGILTEADVFDLREEGDHLTRQIEDLDLARENALVAQEELMNRIATEQNSRMYLLSVVAAVFLPLTFVTGMLGMNVAGLPGTENPNGFWLSLIVMLVVGVGLVGYFRWKKWI